MQVQVVERGKFGYRTIEVPSPFRRVQRIRGQWRPTILVPDSLENEGVEVENAASGAGRDPGRFRTYEIFWDSGCSIRSWEDLFERRDRRKRKRLAQWHKQVANANI